MRYYGLDGWVSEAFEWSFEKVGVSLGILPVILYGMAFWIEKLVARHFPRIKLNEVEGIGRSPPHFLCKVS